MTDEELNALVRRLELRADNGDMGRKPDPATLDRLTISAIRQLMRERDEARLAGAWLYGLELERPGDYAEQKPLAMHACRLAFRHPRELS